VPTQVEYGGGIKNITHNLEFHSRCGSDYGSAFTLATLKIVLPQARAQGGME
jgi:hypothetical protein